MSDRGTHVNDAESSYKLTLSVTAEWEHGTGNTPVYAVISAVADASGMPMTELPPLYDAVDPDALNNLFTARSEPAVSHVSFQYAGYDIVVRESGVVQVQTTVDA